MKIYMDTTGNDTTGNGELLTPFASLFKSCATAQPGDTIHVNAGVYIETNQCELKDNVNIEGEYDLSHIKFNLSTTHETNGAINLHSIDSGVIGKQKIERVKFDGQNLTNNCISIWFRNDVCISECTFMNFIVNAVFAGSITSYHDWEHVKINKIRINNCFFISTGNSVWISGVSSSEIYENYFKEDSRTNTINRALFIWEAEKMKFHGNKCYKPNDNSGEWNFGVEGQGCQGGIEVYNNEFYGNGSHLNVAGTGNFKGDYEYAWWIHDNKFSLSTNLLWSDHGSYGISFESSNEYMIINNNHFKNLGRGISFLTNHADQYFDNVRIFYNIFENIGSVASADHMGRAVQIITESLGTYGSNFYIDNNVMTFNGESYEAVYLQANLGEIHGINVRNNIVENVLGTDGYLSTGWINFFEGVIYDVIVKNNILNNNYNDNLPYNTLIVTNLDYSGNIIDNPDFVASNNFQLQAGSPAINAGIDVGLTKDFAGVAITNPPEIGAYQYN